jgi:chromosome segregation ATPase
LDAKEQVKQLRAALEQKEAEIAGKVEQIAGLGAFKAEALNARDKIAKLEADAAEKESALSAAVKAAAEAKSAAASAGSASAGSAKKVAAAEDLVKAIKVLLGA